MSDPQRYNELKAGHQRPPAELGPARQARNPGSSSRREQPAKRRAFEVVIEERDGHPLDDREPASVIRVRR
jgi:hypothetical protein